MVLCDKIDISTNTRKKKLFFITIKFIYNIFKFASVFTRTKSELIKRTLDELVTRKRVLT